MKTKLGYLTQGRAWFLIRLSALIGIAFALAGILLLLAPPPKAPALKDVAQAAPRRSVNYPLLFPKYRDLTGTRATPFEFQELARIKVQLRVKESESQPPKPDVGGLVLVGTAPGVSRALAVLLDEQSGQMTNIGRGDEIRNSVVKDIQTDKIILVLDAEEAELALAPVQGSENLLRQLQGLPPLPEQQASENKQARQRAQSLPTQASGNAILVAASGTPTPSTVVTQSGSSSRSALQSGPGDSTSEAGTGSSPSSQNSAIGQSGDDAMQNQESSSSEQPSSRSLEISGYMLSLESQQELGLQETGLLITAVRDSSSPIQENDVILAIAGQSFGTLGEARNLLQSVQGSTVQLKVFRNGAPTQLSAPLE